MSFSINTNIASLQARNYLRLNNDFQTKTISRVTSGLRIVQSGDDAAGLAIANSYRSDEAVLTQGVRNANDGLSQLQVIDGGLNNVSQLLDRARTLATQSASGTFTGDRSVLNQEFQSVLQELDRQAQTIGLNSNGIFATNISVFIGGGKTSNGINSSVNGTVAVDLSTATVDARSLGLRGVQASGIAGTDIGTGSASTSLTQIFANATNAASTQVAGYTKFILKGPGFDSNGVAVSVNTQNLGSASDLVGAINAAISSAANSGTQQATALRNAQITASITTDATGKQQLAFTSSSTAFQVEAGDRVANALLGNFAQNAAATGTDTNATVDTSSNTTLQFHFNGSATATNVTVAANAVTSKGSLVAQLNADAGFSALATASLNGNQIVITSKSSASTSAVVVNHTALSDSIGLSAGADVTSSAVSASTGAPLTTSVQGATAVAGGQNLIGTDTAATANIAASSTFILSVGSSGSQTLNLTAGTGLTKAQIAADINTQITANGNFTGANAVTAKVVNNQIVFTAAAPGKTITIGNGTVDATLGFTNTQASTTTTVTTSDTIKLRFQGSGLTAPVDVTLASTTAGTTTIAQVLADLQNKIAGNSQLTGAGISLTTSSAGNNLVFTSTKGEQFSVQASGDSANILGLGSFVAGSNSAIDYTSLTGASYTTGTANGSGNANLAISLNGQAASTITANLAGGDATSAATTGGVITFTAGRIDLSGGTTGIVALRIDGGAQVNVNVGTSATTTVSTLLNSINTALAGAATASLDSTGTKLVFTSAGKGANSEVEVVAAGAGASDAATLTALNLTAGVNRGANATAANVVQQLNSAIASNASLVKAGLQASVTAGQISLTSTNGTYFRVNANGSGNIGFGNLGTSGFAGNTSSTAPASSPVFDSNGADVSSALTFNDLLYAGDKQNVAVTANDASGVKHSIGIVLENDSTVRNAQTIDAAISTINSALQQSNDSTLQKIVAVKDETGGSQTIRFISTVTKFQVSTGSTPGGTGITPPTGNVETASTLGTGSNASIADLNSAQSAVIALATAVQNLGRSQAAVGKGENSFTYAVNLAQSQLTNEQAAESQIRDADLANESANLTKAQILLQAGVAALSQANSAPQQLLALLQGR